MPACRGKRERLPYKITDLMLAAESLITGSAPIREAHTRLVGGKIFGVARDEQAIFYHRRRPDDRIGKFEPMFSSQRYCFFRDLRGERNNSKMIQESTARLFVG